jgi:DNA-binding IclR family transcriptional regulator
MDAPASQPQVRALERGLDILDCFHSADEVLTLTAVASAVDLSPSTALRILSTLEKKNYLVRNEETKRYRLGPAALRFGGGRAVESLAVLGLSSMRELNALFGESVSLYVPSADKRVCIQRVEGQYALRHVVRIGDALSLTVGAGGKVLTAWLALSPNHDVTRLMPPLSPALLAQVREAGYAVSFGEREEGTYAVAAPVFDGSGHILAALTLAGPTSRFNPDKLSLMSAQIMEKAGHISALMGWKGGGAAQGKPEEH